MSTSAGIPAQTPSQRAGQAQTWEQSLNQYLQSQGSTPPATRSPRGNLVAALKAAPESAEAWWAFLSHEESVLAANTGTLTSSLRAGRHSVTLFHLFTLATHAIPRKGNYENKAYLHIWLGYARQQWQRSQDEARDTFKMLKSQLAGDNFAHIYAEWALLEHTSGNKARALSILNKGIASGAQPISLLETTRADIEADKTLYKPPVQSHTTGHSSMSTVTSFMTPANGASARRMLPRSPTLEITAPSQDVKAYGDGPAQGTTITARKTALGEKSAHEAEVATMTIRGGQMGHTTASMATGHSLSSEEATYALTGGARPASPVTGHTTASTSSHGSADESIETVHLKHSRSLDTVKPSSTPADDPTCLVGQALQHKKIAHRPLQSSFRGPRRIGKQANDLPSTEPATRVGLRSNPVVYGVKADRGMDAGLAGGASRVLSGEHTAVQTLTLAGESSAQPSSGEKRKAEADAAVAHSSSSRVSLAGGAKRRMSPEPEAKPGGSTEPSSSQPALPVANRLDGQEHGVQSMASTLQEHSVRPVRSLGASTAGRANLEETVELQNSSHARRASNSIPPRALEQVDKDIYIPPSKPHTASASNAVKLLGSKSAAMDIGLAHPAVTAPSVKGDAEATQPFSSQPTATKPSTPASAAPVRSATPNTATLRARPVPPPPPAGYSSQRPAAPAPPVVVQPQASTPASATQPSGVLQVQPAKENGLTASRPAQQPAAMGPPPNRPRQPLASISDKHAQQAQSSAAGQEARKETTPRQRWVREDENMVMVRGTRYTKLECVGRGGSSKVYKVMAPNRKIFALKRIKLQGRDREAAAGFIDEIALLQRLRGHSNIIQLIDAEVIQNEGSIYMVLEYGDIDLARLLAKHEKARREGGSEDLDENFIRLYWQQMLQAVHTIHEARIVHSDLKPANFLMVEGTLKLIDFGIAKAIQSDTTSIARESQVGTLNYMSPEAILGGANNIRGGAPMKVGRASDIWSLGCILYQMVHGHTPFSQLAFIQKMHAITDNKHHISFPAVKNAALQDTVKRCLDRNPRTRITMQELLDHPFLRPTAAPAPGLVGVTRSQLKKLLAQLSAVTPGGGDADIDLLSEELFRQLANGEAVDLAALIAKPQHTASSSAATLPQGTSMQRRPPAAAKPPAHEVLGNLHHDIKAGKAALRRVAPPAPTSSRPQMESALEAKLREGIAKFRFDDTAGSSLPGDDGTTHNFSP